jgi:hypothetical protein
VTGHSPPAASGQDIRLSPACAKGLLHERYDLRGRDGLRICIVSRDAAARQIAVGTVELVLGASGAYLRATSLPYPDQARHAHIETDSRIMQHGQPPKGAIRPVVYSARRPATGQVGSFRARRIGPGHTTPAA